MCLALPLRIVERTGDEGVVELGGSRIRVGLVLTPDAGPGDWVLVHAGFAIERLSEEEARSTFEALGPEAAS